jgi:Zn-dependent M16 (insulinase) family peptidase
MPIVEGFEFIKEEDLPELNSKGKLYRHIQTGAELLSIENDDENKVFGITFRTPPFDSTGNPHIIEHSVLGGSRKYPVKEPFVQLVKGSLNTYLNAFTYPDKTCYPVASQNLQDFYNLVDVYLDAVFYPLLSLNTFKQEGWHYELDSINGPLTFKGVVFNEMKGAYSSPESVLEESVQHELFPDSAYRHNSGGDPVCIPDLTYDGFKQFHATYYHPSNARLYFYGDDDPLKRLQILNGYLSEFKAIQVQSGISLQAPFDKPHCVTLPYEVSEEDNKQKNLVAINWLLTEVSDPELRIGLNVLNHILIGTPASPLRVALIESGLGEDLVGPGLIDELRQLVYSTGLKGVANENTDKVEPLILATLVKLATQGIDPETIAASMNTIEFALRENNTGNFPRGLAVMLRSLGTWLYDGDPFVDLHIDGPINAIKQRLAAGEHYFENLIAETLLTNPHRVVVILEPDPALGRRRAEEEQSRLNQARAKMSLADLKKNVEETLSLKRLQETPDSPEALATIPFLSLSDLDRKIRLIPKDSHKFEKTEILYHDLFTNGIIYFDLGLNLHNLPQEWLPYIPLFGRAITEMGTEDETYVKLLQRIGKDSGGIHDQTFVSQVFQLESSEGWLFIRGKSLASKTHLLMAIFSDILVRGNLDDQERFKQMALEEKASVESSLVNAGHRFVNSRLRSSLNEAGAVNEQMSGISYLYFLRELLNQIDQDWPKVSQCLKGIRSRLVNRKNIIVNVTVDRANWEKYKDHVENFIKYLPGEAIHSEVWLFDYINSSEGLTIPSQVNFVGKAGNIFESGYQLNGSILAIMQYLNTTWIWDKVRVQGGAYGGFALFDQFSGVLSYLSYRDPNLFETLLAYDMTPSFLRQGNLDQSELVKSIIGAVGDLDAYQLPDAKGFTSLVRHLLGVTDEWRQNFRDELLGTKEPDFKKFADAIDGVSDKGHVVVIGSADVINKANIEKPGWLVTQKVL